ncbi:MAG: flagellar hook protein FlgE [Burkholderiales bacterium]
MSFQQGLSGLDAATKYLDVIGNNVANSNTVGFKGASIQFNDAFASSLSGSGSNSVGIGASVGAILPNFTQGNITVTNNPLDIAINGAGFFRISDQGAITYSRNGQYQLDNRGYIVNGQGARLTGFQASPTGTIVASSPSDLKVATADIAPAATSSSKFVVNVDSRVTPMLAASFNPADTTTFHSATSVSVYDSLGNAHTLSSYFVKTTPNTWQIFATNDGVQIGAGPIGALTFLGNGGMDMTATTMPFNASATLTNGADSPFNFTVDFTGSTQFGSTFGVIELDQDGFASGKLSGFTMDGSGVLIARYSNGQTRPQGQVVLANFTNTQGLRPLGSNGWAETTDSGPALIGAPGSGNLGVVQSGAVEDSNVDLTKELVAMITVQRVYQANAQSIKTMDSVLQTVVNLR